MSSLLARLLVMSGVGLCVVTPPARAQKFNAEFLKGLPGGPSVDLSYFDKSSGPPPGDYKYDLRLMGRLMASRSVRFGQDGEPQITLAILEAVGVDVSKLESTTVAKAPVVSTTNEATNHADSLQADAGKSVADPASEVVDLPELLPGARVAVKANENVLDFEIPGKWLKENVSNSESKFDALSYKNGVPAGFLSYNVVANRQWNHSNRSTYSGIFNYGASGGEDLDGWGFVGSGSYSQGGGNGSKFQTGDNYLAKDFPQIHGRLAAGAASAGSSLFGGYSLKGVNLSSDMLMYPPGYDQSTPTIRGIANSNATVTIYRAGRPIATKVVPPGPFAIDDLVNGFASGTYDVVVREADGRETHSPVTFNSVAQQLHQGVWTYNFSAGLPNHATVGSSSPLFEGEASYGVTDSLTFLAGAAYHSRYQGVGVGIASNLGVLGGVSGILSLARSRVFGSSASGASLNASYVKSFGVFTVNLNEVHNFDNYRSLQDTFEGVGGDIEYDQFGNVLSSSAPRFLITRDNWNAGVSAAIAGGSLSASLNETKYTSGDVSRNISLSYSHSLGRVGSLALTYSDMHNINQRAERQIMATWTLPLGKNIDVSYGYANSFGDGAQNQVTVSQSQLGDRHQFDYSIIGQLGAGANGVQASATYRAPFMKFQAFDYQAGATNSSQLSMSGSVVAHGHGLTASSQQINDSYVIIDAGLPHIAVENYLELETDPWGFAILGNGEPYRREKLSLVTKDLPQGYDVKNGTVTIRARHRAASVAKFDTFENRRALVTVTLPDGKAVPFGAYAEDSAGREAGWVGQDGQLFVENLVAHGNVFHIKHSNQHCDIRFDLPEHPVGIYDAEAVTCELKESSPPPAQEDEKRPLGANMDRPDRSAHSSGAAAKDAIRPNAVHVASLDREIGDRKNNAVESHPLPNRQSASSLDMVMDVVATPIILDQQQAKTGSLLPLSLTNSEQNGGAFEGARDQSGFAPIGPSKMSAEIHSEVAERPTDQMLLPSVTPKELTDCCVAAAIQGQAFIAKMGAAPLGANSPSNYFAPTLSKDFAPLYARP